MPRPRKGTDKPAEDRHTTPRMAFHAPDAYLQALRALAKKSKRTLTAELLLALEEYFERNAAALGGLWPPAEPAPDAKRARKP